MKLKNLFLLILFSGFMLSGFSQQYFTQKGKAHFISDAPLELIEATSNELKGILDIKTNTFAFSINVASFVGFNSPLQKEHFNENYMETDMYPKANFKGKIIEEVDLSKKGTYNLRAKGILKIKEIEQERIIPVTIEVTPKGIKAASSFDIPLTDYNIIIPKLVYQKIADIIKVTINANLELKD